MGSWWRHQMESFSALLAICAGNSPLPCEFPSQSPVTWTFDVYFDLRLNKRLSKQSWGCWFETLSSPLWRHSNEYVLKTMCRRQDPLWVYKCSSTQVFVYSPISFQLQRHEPWPLAITGSLTAYDALAHIMPHPVIVMETTSPTMFLDGLFWNKNSCVERRGGYELKIYISKLS